MCTILSIAFAALISYLFIVSCGELIYGTSNYPFLSIGVGAKGFIAIGLYAEGIVAIGVIGQGLCTISMGGYGLMFFLGQVGGGLGLGIYQLGICYYCFLAQVSIGIWETKKCQVGVSLLSPCFNPERKYIMPAT